MTKLTILSVSGILLALASAPAIAADCNVPAFQTFDNQTVEGKMTVKTGKNCSINMGGGVINPAVTKKPKNGTADYRELRIVYMPKKGFVGQDEFTYERSKMDNYGKIAKRTVVMKVDVVP